MKAATSFQKAFKSWCPVNEQAKSWMPMYWVEFVSMPSARTSALSIFRSYSTKYVKQGSTPHPNPIATSNDRRGFHDS